MESKQNGKVSIAKVDINLNKKQKSNKNSDKINSEQNKRKANKPLLNEKDSER